MNLSGTFFLKVVLTLVIAVLSTFNTAEASDALRIVENDKVCMVTNVHFGKKQIPVTHAGKTYYGCCDMCKTTLSKDAKARTAIDPVSGKSVDKAKAVIAAQNDDSVLYFESKKNFEEYAKTMSSFKSDNKSSNSGHSHH